MNTRILPAALAVTLAAALAGCQSTAPSDDAGKSAKADATKSDPAAPTTQAKKTGEAEAKKEDPTPAPVAKKEEKKEEKKPEMPEVKGPPPPAIADFKPTASLVLADVLTACAKCDKAFPGAVECGLVVREKKTGKSYLVFNAAQINKELFGERHKDNETRLSLKGQTDGKLIKAEQIVRFEETVKTETIVIPIGPQPIKKIVFVDLAGKPLAKDDETPLRRLAVSDRLKEGVLFDRKTIQRAMDALQPFIDAGSGVKFDEKTGTLEFRIKLRVRDGAAAAPAAPAERSPLAVAAPPDIVRLVPAAAPAGATPAPVSGAGPEVILIEGELVCTKCVLGAAAECRPAVRKGAVIYVLSGARLGEQLVKACHAGDRKVSFVGKPTGADDGRAAGGREVRFAPVEVLSAKLLAE